MYRFAPGALALWLIAAPAASQSSGSPADGPWWGSVKCTLDVAEANIQRNEVQTWTLSGAAPTVQGAMRIFPAMWSATGQGAVSKNPRAPAARWTASVPNREVLLAAFVRASDGKLIFRQWSARAEVAKAVTMAQAAIPAAAVNEWDFGWIETNETHAGLSGVRTATAPTPPAQLSIGGPAPVPSCDWQFSRSDPNAPAPPPGTVATNTRQTRSPPPPGVVLTPPPALPAPGSVQATYVSPHTVTLTWAAVTGATNYRIDGTGVAAAGITADANATTVTINNVPNGAGGWTVGAMRGGQTTPELTAGASLMVRELPSHAPAFLTKNNGAGSPPQAIAHYKSACAKCIAGMTLADVAKDLQVPLATLQGTSNWDTNNFEWRDEREAVYHNEFEFGHSKRVSRCWPAPVGRMVCYANDSKHGLTVIVRQGASSWFMVFRSTQPDEAVLENGGGGGDTDVTSDYVLTFGTNLDDEGIKYAPHACVACHGGRVTAAGPVTGATLLPLDPARMYTNDMNDVDVLNKQILSTSPPAAVVRYLYGIYGGNPLRAGAAANRDYVPAGWSNNAGLYRQVIRPYCIACHLNTPTGVDLSSESSATQRKTQILNAVCVEHSMPHAEFPFKDFWTRDTGSVYLPGLLSAAFGGGNCN